MAHERITKLTSLERQLDAAIYLTLRQFWPEPTHTLIGAIRGVLNGLHKVQENKFLAMWEQKIVGLIVPGHEREWRKYENRVANFLKHADRDPDEIIEDVDLVDLNEIGLFVCILGYSSLGKFVSPRIVIGFLYCALLNENWLDVDAVVRDAGMQEGALDEYRFMPKDERRRLMLDAFELSILAKD